MSGLQAAHLEKDTNATVSINEGVVTINYCPVCGTGGSSMQNSQDSSEN